MGFCRDEHVLNGGCISVPRLRLTHGKLRGTVGVALLSIKERLALPSSKTCFLQLQKRDCGVSLVPARCLMVGLTPNKITTWDR